MNVQRGCFHACVYKDALDKEMHVASDTHAHTHTNPPPTPPYLGYKHIIGTPLVRSMCLAVVAQCLGEHPILL